MPPRNRRSQPQLRCALPGGPVDARDRDRHLRVAGHAHQVLVSESMPISLARARPGADSSWHPGRCRSRSARRVMDRSRWSCWAASTRPRPQRLSGPPFAAGAEVLIAPDDGRDRGSADPRHRVRLPDPRGRSQRGLRGWAWRPARSRWSARVLRPCSATGPFPALRRAAARLPDRHRGSWTLGRGTAQPPTEINTCRSNETSRDPWAQARQRFLMRYGDLG